MRNLRSYVSSRADIASHWLEIPRPQHSNGLVSRTIADNWTLRASASTLSAAHGLHKRGYRIKAAFFNHLTALSFFPLARRIPCILSIDTTPVLLNRDREWYRPHGFHTTGVAEHLSKHWTRWTYSGVRYLLPWSKLAADSLMNDYKIRSNRIVIQPPGIDLSFWKPIQNGNEQRERFSVLFVGGDFLRKGGDTLLRVALDDNFRDVDFHFVTKSFSGPTPHNVHVHDDVLPNSDCLVNLYQNSDVFVLPTHADYAPTNAVVEAFATGLPVISTEVGGLGELLAEDNQGFVIGIGDSDNLGKRLVQLKEDKALLSQMKCNARKYAEKNFDIRANGSKIIDMLAEISS